MNYSTFIVKILEKPIQVFFDDINTVTRFRVQLPQLKNNGQNTVISVTIWGKLGSDISKYYQINDYIIIEGYLSIRENLSNQLTVETSKKVEVSIYKIYPFIL